MKQLNWYQIFGNTHKIPDGRTVEPTDDIQIWLNCADIWDKTYTTLAEVLADTDTLLALISSNNAVDYMVRSVSWANDTSVPTMTSNTTPSGEVIFLAEHSDYKGYKAFDGNNSSFWNTGSPTLPTWLGYDFQTRKKVESVYVQFASYNTSATVKVQGSDDKITWNDESEETVVTGTTATTIPADGYYRYHRLYISAQTKTSTNSGCITTLQFSYSGLASNATAMTYIGLNNYCANTLLADATWCEAIVESEYFESVLNAKVPVMTSATQPYGVVSAKQYLTDYDPYLAFDGTDSTQAIPQSSLGQTGWIQYMFTSGVRVIKAKITSFALWHSGYSGKIQGSNDGVTWTDLANVTVTETSTADTFNYNFANNTSTYTYYRLNITSVTSSTRWVRIATLQFYGRKDV